MNELENVDNINIDALYNDVAGMIEKAKQQVAIHVNTELVILNWNIGNRIKVELLNNKKPEYGKQVIKELSKKLVRNYGRGYSSSNLYRMLQLNEFFEDFENFATLSQKLSWSHFIEIVKMDTDIKRKFYATMCINEHWSVRTLRERIGSALFERTAISKKPEQTIINDLQLLNNENKMTTDLFFRDPYILDFLELKDTYSKKDLENAIISELEKFIILCATKSDTMAELLELDNSGIHVAQYLTNYVPKELLEEKFLSSIKNAKIQLEQRNKKEEKD